MFVRKKHNKSGSTSIQIIDKSSGKYKVIETIGHSKEKSKVDFLIKQAQYRISEINGQEQLELLTSNDQKILEFLRNNRTLNVRVTGPEDILGKTFDSIGFKEIKDELFRYLVITRLVHPVSKLKTIDYLRRYNKIEIKKDEIYRFLDKLNKRYKGQLEQIAFEHTAKILHKKIAVVFYDITTLYFEASSEDDLRKLGFSKDGKSKNPQILLGLLVGQMGYPIGYDIFEGNKYEGKTLIPTIEKYVKRFGLAKPIIIADAGLLSKDNIEKLEGNDYQYIIGGRIKNETQEVKAKILALSLRDGAFGEIKKPNGSRLIVSYSSKRARMDESNRKRGLNRLEKIIASKTITKKQINNRGYNKYLKLSGTLSAEIDYQKYQQDAKWDGLKGYLTNSKLPADEVLENYGQLWQIEKAFRISKTDLRVRPVYHRLRQRIEAHISIAFAAYTVYKEIERIIQLKRLPLTAKRVIELTETIYTLDFLLPESKQKKSVLINLSDEQKLIYKIISG